MPHTEEVFVLVVDSLCLISRRCCLVVDSLCLISRRCCLVVDSLRLVSRRFCCRGTIYQACVMEHHLLWDSLSSSYQGAFIVVGQFIKLVS